jgi:hypothetical protein
MSLWSFEQKKETKETYKISLRLFFHFLGAIYFVAFASLFVQLKGLYGSEGLEPVSLFLERTRQRGGNFNSLPTIVWFASQLSVSVDTALDLLCLVGLLASLMVILGMHWSIMFLILWSSYLSLYLVGQTFLSFQWDLLLLETGFLAVLISPCWRFLYYRFVSDHQLEAVFDSLSSLKAFVVQWLVFRLMFSSGLVKLASDCPTWWRFTALDYHYYTQCIPSPVAWYAWNYLPKWFHRLSVWLTFVIEIILPFWFFVPFEGGRLLRLISGLIQILFQIILIVTGNYGFFNYLTIVLCIPLFDDYFLHVFVGIRNIFSQQRTHAKTPRPTKKLSYIVKPRQSRLQSSNLVQKVRIPQQTPQKQQSPLQTKVKKIAAKQNQRTQRKIAIFEFVPALVVVALTVYILTKYCNYRFSFDKAPVVVSLRLTKAEFRQFVAFAIPLSLFLGAVTFTVKMLYALYLVMRFSLTNTKTNCLWKLYLWMRCLVVVSLLAGIVLVSMVPYASRFGVQDVVPSKVTEFYHKFPYLAFNYGLFARMTTERLEVTLEGSNDGRQWAPYHFKYKPGELTRAPPFVAPHQPRLDWQMWFAALGSINQNSWLFNLAVQILRNNSDVLELMDTQTKNPFPFKPPTYIRAIAYDYKFTTITDNSTQWWQRSFHHEYMPKLSLKDPRVTEFLKLQQMKSSRKASDFDQAVETFSRVLRTTIPDLKLTFLLLCIIILSVLKT